MWIIGFLIGANLGSFAKALADRSLKGKSFRGRSYCEFCKTNLAWYDLFPILSFCLLRGKCRYCKKAIGLAYALIELVMAVLTGYLFYQSNFQTIQTIFDLVFKTFFITILAVIFLTDLKKMLVPDRVIIPSIKIAFFSLLAFNIYKVTYLYFYLKADPLGKYLIFSTDYFWRHTIMALYPFLGALAVGAGIAAAFYLLIVITKGKGLGGGDVKLGLFLGLGLGFPNGILAVILGFLSGAAIGVAALITGKKGLKSQIPFGPFLIFGSLVALFWGNQIMEWYIKVGT